MRLPLFGWTDRPPATAVQTESRLRKSAILFSILAVLSGLIAVFVHFLTTTRQWVFLLQNADEVRATGGFLGSVYWARTRGWRWQGGEFVDIYYLDNQLPEFPSAPAGVRHYLTGGRDELHLSDANWERDFPTSARHISDLLQAAGQPAPDLIVAVNSTLIAQLLDQLPEVSLSVDGQQLTGDNFSTLARRGHDLFSPQRQPKTRFLTSVARQVWNYSQTLSWTERGRWGWWLFRRRADRQWQAYSPHWSWQQIIKLLGAAGQTHQSHWCQDVYVVASNVGINKSNRLTTSRLTDPTITPLAAGRSLAQVKLIIVNNNPLNESALVTQRLHFADYQRLLIPPGVSLTRLNWRGRELTEWDDRTVVDAAGHQWQEIGFLIIINEQDQGELEIELTGSGQCWHFRE